MIQFGTLGTADITPQALIYPCINEPKASVAVISARSKERATAFALHHHIPKVMDYYDQVIKHPDCNALYLPLPISHHKQWGVTALRAGKHVLCEKSLASNAEEAQQMAEVAKQQNLILMDAFHYRYHPLFHAAKDIYDSGVLGDITEIDAAFTVSGIIDPKDIRMNFETGGGVTMDIGCYPISWIRHLTGLEPTNVEASAEIGPPNVDTMLEAKLELPNGVQARSLGDMRPNGKFQAHITVTGTQGTMKVLNPLAPHMGHLLLTEINGEKQTQQFDRRTTYCYQMDAFIHAVESGESPLTDAQDAIKQMKVIDQCYLAANLPRRGTIDA